MRTLIWVAVAAALAAGCVPDGGAATPESAPYLCRTKTGVKISVDGKLEEPLWRASTPMPVIRAALGRGEVQATVVFLGWDKTSLYAAFLCADADVQLHRASVARDGEIGFDDRVGLALKAPGSERIACFEISAAGSLLDYLAIGAGGALDPKAFSHKGVRAAVVQTADGYTVELAVPWEALGRVGLSAPLAGAELAASAYRSDMNVVGGRMREIRSLWRAPGARGSAFQAKGAFGTVRLISE